jgi:2',3'-cyclic-nucleotide 2'-phosphodiesterase / 3'-nucleotidase / 5'-nucleotidase
MRDGTKADFSFMNSGGIRDNLNQGPITWGELFAIQPFGNDIVTLKVTGEQIRTLLNQQFSADRNRIMAVSGLKYTWSVEKPLGEKVLDIFLPNGSKIDPKAEYTIAVNNFMADGGDGYTILKQGKERKVWLTDLDTLVNYVKAQTKPITAAIEGRILIAKESTVDNPTTNPTNPTKPTNPADPTKPTTNPTTGAKLPNTATNMYNYLLFGILIVGLGITLIVRRRKLEN